MKTNEVLENIKARRSVRAYTDRQVSEEDLQAILEAATFAPSGMHLETWHFTAIQNADKLAELMNGLKALLLKAMNRNYRSVVIARRIAVIIMPRLW